MELLIEQLEEKDVGTPFCYEPVEISEVIININEGNEDAGNDTEDQDFIQKDHSDIRTEKVMKVE